MATELHIATFTLRGHKATVTVYCGGAVKLLCGALKPVTWYGTLEATHVSWDAQHTDAFVMDRVDAVLREEGLIKNS